MINIIVAVDKKYGIAKNGKLPWHIKEDLRYFSKVTQKTKDPHKMNAVIMGRKTWQSLKSILKNRVNIILSNTLNVDELYDDELYDDNVNKQVCRLAKSLDNAIQLCNENNDIETIFIIGGTRVYKEALDRNLVNKIYMTKIDKDYECDTFFPYESFNNCMMINKCKVKKDVVDIKNKNISQITYCEYDIEIERRTDGEYQYLNLLRKILSEGNLRKTRNAKTLSIFGEQLRFDLAEGFPLLTIRKVWLNGIIKELLWFLRGDTNANHLSDMGVKVWNMNSSRKFLDSVGLHNYEIGDIGNIYGFQFRYASAEYKGMNHNYTGKGFDQLRYVIETIRKDPMSRRIIMSSFNAKDSGLGKGCLYPCHGIVVQFYCREDCGVKYLDCSMYQRSADMALGICWNISSYALLVHIISKVTNRIPGVLTLILGDCHVYSTHINAIKNILKRKPYKFPEIELLKYIDSKSSNIDDILKYITDLKHTDFKLSNYHYHPKIKIQMIA